MTVVIERPPKSARRPDALIPLIAAVRTRLRPGLDALASTNIAVQCLREYQPGPDLLSPEQQAGSEEHGGGIARHRARDAVLVIRG